MAKKKQPAPKKGGKKKVAPKKAPARNKPIPQQVAEREVRQRVVHKGRAVGKREGIAATAFGGPHSDATKEAWGHGAMIGACLIKPGAHRTVPLHPTVEEQFQAEARALPKAPAPKPNLWHRFRSAITGRWVSRLFAKTHPATTVREKAD